MSRSPRVANGIVALGLLLAAVAPAEARIVGRIVEKGEVTGRLGPANPVEPGDRVLAPTKPLAARRFVDHSDVIEARLCRHFGITVRLTADGSDAMPSRVRIRVRHPPMTRPDGETSREDVFASIVSDGEIGVGFGFEEPYEMVAGEWSIAVLVEGQEVAAQAFTVTLPPEGAPRSDCLPQTVS